MVLVLAAVAVLAVALGVIRAAAKVRLADLALDLDDAWADVDDARAVRRDLVGDLVALLAEVGDLGPRERRVADDLRREHRGAARASTVAATARIEQRLITATAVALDLAARRPELADEVAALRAGIGDASADLRDASARYNERVAQVERTAASFAGVLVGDVPEHHAVRLGHERLEPARPVRSG